MSQHRQRASFNQAGEVLEHSIDYLQEIGDVLEQLQDAVQDERVRLLLDSVAVEQRNLLGAIERYQEDADARVLNAFSQFTVELPENRSGPAAPLTTDDLTSWLITMNQHLVETFRELADTVPAEAARTGFKGLADQVEAHNRRLAKEHQRFGDL